jgi:hypothetical protein
MRRARGFPNDSYRSSTIDSSFIREWIESHNRLCADGVMEDTVVPVNLTFVCKRPTTSAIC